MYVLNAESMRMASRNRGYGSLASVLKKLGLHRNTLDRFLKGSPVLPLSINMLLDELELPLDKALIKKQSKHILDLPISKLVREIHGHLPQVSIFLFGSRSRQTAKRYSDFDIGLYRNEGLTLKEHLKAISLKEEFEDNSEYFVDCLNLNSADKTFLSNIAPDLQLLAGYQSDLLHIREKIQ